MQNASNEGGAGKVQSYSDQSSTTSRSPSELSRVRGNQNQIPAKRLSRISVSYSQSGRPSVKLRTNFSGGWASCSENRAALHHCSEMPPTRGIAGGTLILCRAVPKLMMTIVEVARPAFCRVASATARDLGRRSLMSAMQTFVSSR